MQFAPGQQVERYEIEGLIGQGGLAEVYRVRHLELGNRAALKVLRRESEGIFHRTMREGRLQAGLKHPNVVAVYDVLRVGAAPALVMEYVAGPSLEQLLRQFQPSLTQTDALGRGVISGVIAAHRAGLVHRDLKPANVLIAIEQGQPVPKVADFGLARAAVVSGDLPADPRLTRQGAMLGTPAYMAPEQYSDASSVDGRADVFGLGALLYELVTGVMAFPGRDAMECYRSILQSSWRPVRELVPSAPGRMVRAIEAALEPDAEKRVASAEQLLAIWTGESEGRVSALPDGLIWEPEHVEMVRALTPPLRGEAAAQEPVGASRTPDLEGRDLEGRDLEGRDLDGRDLEGPNQDFVVGVPSSVAPSSEASAGDSLADGPSRSDLRGAPTGKAIMVGLALLGLLLWFAGGALSGGKSGSAEVQGATSAPAPGQAPTSELQAQVDLPAEPAPEGAPSVAAPPAPSQVSKSSAPVAGASAAAVVSAPEAAPLEVAPAPVAHTAPAAAADNVIVNGVSRSYLVAADGTRRQPGLVPPGHYTLYVFFEPSDPTPALDIDVVEGRTVRIRCEPGLRSCR